MVAHIHTYSYSYTRCHKKIICCIGFGGFAKDIKDLSNELVGIWGEMNQSDEKRPTCLYMRRLSSNYREKSTKYIPKEEKKWKKYASNEILVSLSKE